MNITTIGRVLALVLVALGAATAQAQDYPARPVKMIISITAGAGPDVVTRIVAEHLGKRWGQEHKPESVRRSMARVREIGWHARLHISGSDVPDWGDFLRSVKDLTMVIDHMGHLDFALGLEQPSMRWILDRLQEDNWWLKLSNGNRDSVMETGWDDAIPYGKAFIAAAPDRMIRGSEWPHTGWRKQRMMNDAETVELLYRYVDNDAELVRKILADNPARLHGFED